MPRHHHREPNDDVMECVAREIAAAGLFHLA
jgi:hypothetical protein